MPLPLSGEPTPLPLPAEILKPVETPDADDNKAADSFKETPTGPALLPLEDAVLQRLKQIQTDLAALIEKQKALLAAAQQIEQSLAQAFLDLNEAHADARVSASPETESTLHRDTFKSAKTSIVTLQRIDEVDPSAEIPDIEIPTDGDWNRWQAAWDSARVRATALGLPRLPGCPATRSGLARVSSLLSSSDDTQLRAFLERFDHFLHDYEESLAHSKLYSSCQALKAALAEARNLDASADTQIARALQSLSAWEEKMSAQHRWFAPDFFDAELTETTTAVYDFLASLQSTQPKLVCEQLRHACDWLLYFLTLLGVHKDSGLSIGVSHEQLPRHLRDKFPVQSLKPGRSADACKITNIVRNRWYRLAENREVQVVRPWYELG